MYYPLIHFFSVLLITEAASNNVFSVDKGVIVHLFEWKYQDIAKECEEFLAPKGFSGVQISPPSENIVIEERPWWERYQPISYKLVSRSGTQLDLADMITRCNKVGVRIFADAILNHMTANYRPAVGVGGSSADPPSLIYSAVPYTADDFRWPFCSVNDYNDANEVRNCELDGLHDLDNSKQNVRRRQVDYLNSLIDLGVAGFRISDAKYMWPKDLKVIYSGLKDLNTKQGFPENTRPLIYQEVIDQGGEAVKYQEYAPLGMVTDFRYGFNLGNTFQGQNDLVDLKNFGTAWNLLPDDTGLVFIDNHDTQRVSVNSVLNYKKFRPYKMALAFMLAFPYGTPLLLSSFYFDSYDQGPPHDTAYNILSPRPITNNICANKWVCEHRWRQVYNMVVFKNVVKGTKVTNWWDNGKNQIAFCRGNKGFIAFNRETSSALDRKLQTCLPKGKYCDVISGQLVNNACTGKTVVVDEDGTGQIQIKAFNMLDPNVENDGVLALHVKEVIFEVIPDKKPDSPSKKPPEGTPNPPTCDCSGRGNPSSTDGIASICEKVLKLLTSSGSSSSSCQCSRSEAGPDDRLKKLEKLLDLLSLI